MTPSSGAGSTTVDPNSGATVSTGSTPPLFEQLPRTPSKSASSSSAFFKMPDSLRKQRTAVLAEAHDLAVIHLRLQQRQLEGVATRDDLVSLLAQVDQTTEVYTKYATAFRAYAENAKERYRKAKEQLGCRPGSDAAPEAKRAPGRTAEMTGRDYE